MTRVYVTYDTQCKTWNAMSLDGKVCYYYGDVYELEEWLHEKRGRFTEVLGE